MSKKTINVKLKETNKKYYKDKMMANIENIIDRYLDEVEINVIVDTDKIKRMSDE